VKIRNYLLLIFLGILTPIQVGSVLFITTIWRKTVHVGIDLNEMAKNMTVQIKETENTRRLSVDMLASSDEEQEFATGYDRGVNICLRKPGDINQFLETILRLGLYGLAINKPPPVN
jgi:hypothetical protein